MQRTPVNTSQTSSYDGLEKQLGVHNDYDKVTWDYKPVYSVYVVHDCGTPVYFGISKDTAKRLKTHVRDASSAIHVYLSDKLAEGFELSDLFFVKHRGLTQRQAAILELDYIYKNRGSSLLNSRSVWLPEGMIDGERLSQSMRFQGRVLPASSVLAIKAKNTNTLKFKLFYKGEFVRTVDCVSRSDLAQWTREAFPTISVDDSAMWRMVVGRRAGYKGFTVVHHTDGEHSSNVHPIGEVVKLRKALPLRPFVILHVRSNKVMAVVGNTKEARDELSKETSGRPVTANTLEYLLSGRHKTFNGYRARYLTEAEVDANLNGFKYPLCYVYSVDNSSNSISRNLSDIAARYGVSVPVLTRALAMSYVFSNGKLVKINLVQTGGISYLIKDVILKAPVGEGAPQRKAKKTSNVTGVTWSETRNSWIVVKVVRGQRIYFKQAQDQYVCEDVSKYIEGLRDEDGTLSEAAISVGRGYARSIKKKNGVWFRSY